MAIYVFSQKGGKPGKGKETCLARQPLKYLKNINNGKNIYTYTNNIELLDCYFVVLALSQPQICKKRSLGATVLYQLKAVHLSQEPRLYSSFFLGGNGKPCQTVPTWNP